MVSQRFCVNLDVAINESKIILEKTSDKQGPEGEQLITFSVDVIYISYLHIVTHIYLFLVFLYTLFEIRCHVKYIIILKLILNGIMH